LSGAKIAGGGAMFDIQNKTKYEIFYSIFDESAKFTAKLRDYKTDNNLLLLKTEMNAGHGGKSGRDSAIEEVALDYAFALKISNKI
jgi:protease II